MHGESDTEGYAMNTIVQKYSSSNIIFLLLFQEWVYIGDQILVNMYSHYKAHVKHEIEKMMDTGLIFPIKEFDWINLILTQGRKIVGIHIFKDFHKLNEAFIHDPFLTPFNDDILENIVGNATYSFTHGFLGYHQIQISKEDNKKKHVCYKVEVVCLQCNTLWIEECANNFSIVVVVMFREYIHKFLEVYLHNWTVYSLLKNHVAKIRLMLDKH